MKMKKKLILTLVIVTACILLFSVLSVSATTSGNCGDNVTWTLDDSGTLTISGSGDMTNWSYGSYAPWYSNRKSVTALVIGDGVTSIGDYAFYDLTSLNSITIPDNVINIGDSAFRSCTGLTSIIIPDSVTSIGYAVFDGCTGLTSITIGENLASVEGNAFSSCSALTQINWNAKSVADFKYQDKNFYNAGLNGDGINIIFGDSVERIPAYLCADSSGANPKIKSITIGENVKSIGNNAFDNCTEITQINWNAKKADDFSSANGIFYKAGHDAEGITVIFGNDVEAIPARIFYSSDFHESAPKITSVTMGDSVTKIGEAAFFHCNNLTDVTIGRNVTNIDSSAFRSCTALASITIPESVTTIGNYAFYDCTGLKSVNITNINAWCNIVFNDSYSNPLYLANNLYINGSLVTNLIIPDNVITISDRAFYNCTGFKSVIIGENVTSIGDSAFRSCTGLTSITIGENLKSIGSYAFESCTALTQINWNAKNVTGISSFNHIFDYAGNNDDGISVIFGDSVETIPAYVLYPSDSSPPKITSITIGENVTSISQSAFRSCKDLVSITIPDSVTTIRDYSFSFCTGLKSVTIGSGVTNIGAGAFYESSAITDVYYKGTREEWENIIISERNEALTNATIHFADEALLTPAEKLCNLINEQSADSCEVDVDAQAVSLLSDVTLTETLVMPTGGEIILDIGRRDILASGDFECISVPESACLIIEGRNGIIMGGTNETTGKSAIVNRGTLVIDGNMEIIGGGNVINDVLNVQMLSSGGSSGGMGNVGTGGSSSSDSTPDATEIPGEVFANTGGAAITNYGELYLNSGKLIGGEGKNESASALNGAVSGGKCILFSDDDSEYTLLNTATPDSRYIYARVGTAGEELYVALNIAKSGCCEYALSTNEQTEETTETIKLVSDVSTYSMGTATDIGAERYPLVIDTGTYTWNVIESVDEDGYPHKTIGFDDVEVSITGSGTINASIYCNYTSLTIDGVTVNGGLTGMYSGCTIKSGKVNGCIAFIGSLQIDGGEIYGYIDGLHTEITINGGMISGETDMDIDVSRGTVWVRSEDITINGGTIIGGVSEDGTVGYNAVSIADEEIAFYFNGGLLIGGKGSVSNGKAVDGVVSKGTTTKIEESNDGIYYTELLSNMSACKYLKATKLTQYHINSITLKDMSGNELTSIPAEIFLATVSFTNVCASEDTVIMLARYTNDGKFMGLMYIQTEDVPIGATIKISIPVDNTSGDIATLKAFCIDSFDGLTLKANSVSFTS